VAAMCRLTRFATRIPGNGFNGLGGEFSGTARVRLVPATGVGAPTTGLHKRGELYVDSQGNLFPCVADSVSSNAVTWKKVVLQ
jgi:hypothetical protein